MAVILLLYVFVGGMLVPLKPGIISVEPFSVFTGQKVTLDITGYNSHYTQGAHKAWLKLDSLHNIASTGITAVNDNLIKATFDIPADIPEDKKIGQLTLIVDSEKDGPSVLPSALSIKKSDSATTAATAVWTDIPHTSFHEYHGIAFPYRNILSESIRNTYFHVPLWFSMMFLFGFAVWHSIMSLRTKNPVSDLKAYTYTRVGMLFGILGILTGALWARHTWGAYWSWDVKQNMTAIALLIYGAYFILRSSIEDPDSKSRVSAVYNIFAFATLIPLIYVIPRLTASLHPGNGGNPAFGSQDMENTMRLFFYPACIGWTLLGFWIAGINIRLEKIKHYLLFSEPEEQTVNH